MSTPALLALALALLAAAPAAAPSSERQPLGALPSRPTKLVPPQVVAGERFGFALAADGDTLAVGAPDRQTWNAGFGAVYVYRFEGGRWQLVKRLAAPDPTPQGWGFGYAVALEDDVLAVGWTFQSWGYASSLVIYERDAGGPDNWGLVQRFDDTTNARVGNAFELRAGELFVGQPGSPSTSYGYHDGEVVVRRRNLGGAEAWGVQTQIDSPMPNCDSFGWRLALEGVDLFIGAPDANPGACYYNPFVTPSVYAWRRDPEGWILREQLLAPDPSAQSYGLSMDMAGGIAAVSWSTASSGRVVLYEREDAGWSELGSLVQGAPTGPTHGSLVSFDGDRLAVGAPGGSWENGEVWLYDRNLGGANAFGLVTTLVAPDGQPNDQFGSAVLAHEGRLFVGAPRADVGVADTGAVYVFEPRRPFQAPGPAQPR